MELLQYLYEILDEVLIPFFQSRLSLTDLFILSIGTNQRTMGMLMDCNVTLDYEIDPLSATLSVQIILLITIWDHDETTTTFLEAIPVGNTTAAIAQLVERGFCKPEGTSLKKKK